MLRTQRVRAARVALLALAVVAAALGGCNRSAIPGLTTPGYALATPAPLPPPGPLPLPPAVAGGRASIPMSMRCRSRLLCGAAWMVLFVQIIDFKIPPAKTVGSTAR